VHPYDEIRAWATRWAQEWFIGPDGADRFQVGSISAGWATHVDAYEALLRFATQYLLARKERTAAGALAILKQHGLDRAVRTAGLRLLRAPGPCHPAANGRPAFVLEVPTPSMLDPARLTARALGEVAVASADPRAWRRLRSDGLQPVGLVVDWRRQRQLLAAASRQVADARDDLLRRPPSITFRNRDVTRSVLDALSNLIWRSMPWLGPEQAAVEEFLHCVDPPAVAIASDQHRIGRIVSAAAARRGISVVVLQHGLPQMQVGLLPVVADLVATWSADSQAWFARHGTDPARLAITGNPRLDALHAFDREQARREVADRYGLNGARRLLLALSPTSEQVNRAVAATVLEATERLPDAVLIIKLHPGQGSWRFLEQQVRASRARDRIRILRRAPLYPLLGWASLTLLHRSTVAVEALAARSPVVVVDAAGARSGADLELAALGPPRVASTEELVVIAGDAPGESYFGPRTTAITRLVGPLDGGSSARIADLVRTGSAAGDHAWDPT
jgi:hypothetical protein